MSPITIAIDAMSGDHGIKSTLPAAILALQKNANLHLILVGNERMLNRALQKFKSFDATRLTVQHASEVVDMDEPPSMALRSKKDSSMRVAINLVKSGQAQACVSAGNTGALMATSRFVLKTIPGIDRPAIIYAFPCVYSDGLMGTSHMLDLGANLDCTADHLFQFALMGSVHRNCVQPESNLPKVALLNIGEEEIKGLDSIKSAAKKLQACSGVNYTGFVEGDDLFKGVADVIVCDGFTGNVALKTVEGTTQFIAGQVKAVFKSSIFARLLSVFALPVLLKLRKKLDSRRYNGASFIGLKGIVVKSHGSADKIAFENAIAKAVKEVENDIPVKIHHQIEQLLEPETNG